MGWLGNLRNAVSDTEHRPWQIVMMGTGPFAVPTFTALLQGSDQIPLLITRPVRPGVGKKAPPESPMRRLAQERGVPVWDPEDVNQPEVVRRLAELSPDLLVVCDYGQLLSAELLSVARRGGINLHGSLLPKYRGAAPINWAIYRGERETGVSVIHLTPGLDAGPVLSRRTLPLLDEDDAESIEPRLAQLGVAAVADAIELLKGWDGRQLLGELQAPELVTRARRLKKEDGRIRWTRSARQVFNQIRAFKPWPGSYTYWQRPGKPPQRWIVDVAQPWQELPESALAAGLAAAGADTSGVAPVGPQSSAGWGAGRVVVAGGHLWVATGDGWLELERLQPEGKRVMTASELLRGTPLQTGDVLGE